MNWGGKESVLWRAKCSLQSVYSITLCRQSPLIWPFRYSEPRRDKVLPNHLPISVHQLKHLGTPIREMDDGRWDSVSHQRRVMFTPVVMDESYFFVSSNPPLLSCKSCWENQPYFFSSFLKQNDTSIPPRIDGCRNYPTPLKIAFLCGLLLAGFKGDSP